MAINRTRQPQDDEAAGQNYNEKGCECGSGRCHCHKGKKIAIAVLLVILIAIIAACFCWPMMNGRIAPVSDKDWQAVFLVNGQVYFGKVKAVSGKTLTLSNIYYLQVVTKPLQQTQQGTAPAADTQSQQLTLIKLGNEIHGPTDQMIINRDQILLTEKLKNDSRVVTAIAKYISDLKSATPGAAVDSAPLTK